MEDDIFDLNNYGEEENTYENIKNETKQESQKQNEDSVKNIIDDEEKININIDKMINFTKLLDKEELIDINIGLGGLDDSFETKLKLGKNKNVLSSEAKEQCIHAIDDTISLSEFDLIEEKALEFPFELDTFQKRSVIRLERHQNVLVCAHTSSGKTVVAEYAIALAKKMNKRVFYTSPIKALSNQKYREFKKKFQDVGILTGDVSLSSDAQCLIMTTEILQSSLYKNSEMLNMVEWVVFDEVHYINDNERGHVWEEILILLPPQIGIVMLSATIPNYLDFAKWVGRIKNTTIYIQNTTHRVVPLEHKIYISNKSIYVARDKSDKVLESNIIKAMNELDDLNQKLFKNKNNPKNKKERDDHETKVLNRMREFCKDVERKEKQRFNKGDNYRGNNNGNKITMTHMKLEEVVTFLIKNDLVPAVIFVFSIKKIDEYAKMIASSDCRVDKATSSKIIKFFDLCMSKLSDEDRRINQVQILRRILPMGIGVHHAGLLPILKETIEILYSKGLLKILFATTSFSIGLNMPTRTVIFTEITKFNEEKKELLSSSEYLQMCGRAGRRGIDSIGHIFLLMGDKNNPPKATDVAEMMKGGGTQVESRFRLSYKTILSFLSRNLKNIVEFFKESYLENNQIIIMPETINKVSELKQKIVSLGNIVCIHKDSDEYIRKYYEDVNNLTSIRKKVFSNAEIQAKLTPGRIVVFNSKKFKKQFYALLLFYYKDFDQYRFLLAENNTKIVAEYEEQRLKEKPNQNAGCVNKKFYRYFELNIEEIVDIVDFTIKVDYNTFDWDADNYCYLKKKDLERYLNELILLNDRDTKIFDYHKLTRNEITAFDNIKTKATLQINVKESKCDTCYLKEDHWARFEEKTKLEAEFRKKDKSLSEENLKYFNEFQIRLEILRKLEYIDNENLILIKGKAAREIASSDCLLISELLMSNILYSLDDAETVAFVSGFVFNRNEIEIEDPGISDNFSKAVDDFKVLADRLVELEKNSEFEESKYNRRITFSTSKAIYLWMIGSPFKDIVKESDLEEGKLYTLLMRLYLFLNEIKNFYEVVGQINLSKKFADTQGKIMRDVLSCKSLYLQEDIDIDADI